MPYILPQKRSFWISSVFVAAAVLILGAFLFISRQSVRAATIVWDGGGATNNWSEGANWSGDVVPGVADVATFNGTSSKDVTIDAPISVSGISVTTAYAGTMTQGAGGTMTVGEGDISILGGIFVGGSDFITTTGFFTLGTISFTSTSGALTVQENFTTAAGTTFIHNNGTVVFRADGTTRNISVSGGIDLYDVEFNATTNTNTFRVTAAGNVTALNSLTLTNGELGTIGNGEVIVDFSPTVAATFDGGNGRIRLTGAASFTPPDGSILPGVIAGDAGTSINGPGFGTTITFEGTLTAELGTINAGAGTIAIHAGMTVEPTGTFNHDNGEFLMSGGSVTSLINANSTDDGTITFYDVTVNSTSGTGTLSVNRGDVAIVSNALTLTNGQVGTTTAIANCTVCNPGTFQVSGSVSIASTFDGGAGVLDLQVATSLAPAAGSFLPGFTLTNPGSDFTGPGSGTVTIEGPVDLVSSTFNAGAGIIEFEDDLVVPPGATFNHDSGTIQFDHAESTDLADVDSTLALFNLTLVGGGLNLEASDTMTVAGLLTLTAGQLDLGTVVQNGTFSTGSSFAGGTGTILFNTLVNITLTDGQDLPGFELAIAGSDVTGAGAATSSSVGGDIVLQAGTTLNAGAGTLVLGGGIDITGGGTFNHDSGTIELEEGNSSLVNVLHSYLGNLTFNNFINVQTNFTNDFTIEFDDASTVTFLGEFILDVDSSNEPPMIITIQSDNPGVQATIDIQDTTPFITDADVSDINNIGTTIRCSVRCTDSGNNDGWYFGQVGVSVTTISGNTTEAGGTATFDVQLTNEPLGDVTVSVASSDTAEGTVDMASLTFTSANWDIPQTVTVTGVDDAVNDGGILFEIILGPAASLGDSGYDGLPAPRVAVINADNDSPADGIDFEDASNFTYEDVAAEAGAVYFLHDYYGHGALFDGFGGMEVDLLSTKIRSGCTISIEGTEWIISRVFEDTAGWGDGYITITADPAARPEVLDLTDQSGFVDWIHCSATSVTGNQLSTDDFVHARTILTNTGEYQMVYDSDNDALWLDVGAAKRVNLTTEVVDEFGSTAYGQGIALDPSRGEIWYGDGSDSLVKVDTTTGADSVYSLGTCTNAESLIYDPTNDRIWALCAIAAAPDEVKEVNPATGAVVQSIVVEVDSSGGQFSTDGITYDSTNNRVWAFIDNGDTAVALDASDGSYAFGTLAASTFNTGVTASSFANVRTQIYDAPTDSIFVMNAQCDVGDDDYIQIMNAATGTLTGYVSVPSCPVDAAVDESHRTIFFTSDHEGTFTEVRLDDGQVIESHVGMDPSYEIALDGEGDIWIAEYDSALHEYVRNGVPTNRYYTTVSGAAVQIDTSAWTSVEGVIVNEDTAGQNIFYTVSFDDQRTFNVFGSYRPIASDNSVIHGGVDGDWYYRNNASSWIPAPTNTKEEAISLAIEAGANNQMSGAELESLSAADWITMGFDPGVTATIDISTTIFTDDAHDSPVVQSIEFSSGTTSGGGGGGGSSVSFPSNGSVSGPACSADNDVQLTLKSSNATMVMLSNDGVFDTESWQAFASNFSGDRETGPDGRLIETMVLNWLVSEGDGSKTVFAQFRSGGGGVSSVYQETFLVSMSTCEETSNTDESDSDDDPAGVEEGETGSEGPKEELVLGCDLVARPHRADENSLPPSKFGIGYEAPLTTELGISPITGLSEPISLVYPGDLFRSNGYTTVYCLHEDGTRHPFVDEVSFFTHRRTFENVKWVTDATLSSFPLETPVLPRPTVVLGKFVSDPRVYRIDVDPENETKLILRHIDDESIAIDSYGPNWADYVIDLNPTLVNAFEYGASIIEPELVNTSEFRKRELLNETNAAVESKDENLFTILAQLMAAGYGTFRKGFATIWPW